MAVVKGGGANDRTHSVEILPNAANARSVDEQTDDEQEAAPQQSVPNSQGGPRFADQDQFVTNDDVYESPIGALLQHNCVELTQAQVACGLAVLEVHPRSAAAAAGIRPYSGLGHTLLGASVVSAAIVFPPAIGALSIVERSRTGESFDLIIGVDGQRIRYIPDFQAAIFNLRDGDVIYLTLVRDGKRLQLPMRIAQRSGRRQ